LNEVKGVSKGASWQRLAASTAAFDTRSTAFRATQAADSHNLMTLIVYWLHEEEI
jgi:hypothetical protein